jgi:hypothetical protein
MRRSHITGQASASAGSNARKCHQVGLGTNSKNFHGSPRRETNPAAGITRAHQLTNALGGRWLGSYGIACCPAHDDRTPSLSICDGDHLVIVNCFAGCDWRLVQAKLKSLGH